MKIFVESWKNAERDHCWLDETCQDDYVEDSTCSGCGSAMQVISEVLNSIRQPGLVTGICPSCGYVKRIRNLSSKWYADHFARNWLKNRLDEPVVEDRYLYEFLAPFLPDRGRVLDVGCGLGSRLISFKKAGFDVFGVEPSERRSSAASQVLGNIETCTGEDYLAGCKNAFNVIYFFDVIQFIKDPFKLLSMAVEKLADNGMIYIHVGTFHRDSNFCQFSHIGVLHSFISLFALKDVLSQSGLSPVYYSERPFELVLKKADHDEIGQRILKGGKKITVDDMERFAKKTLKINRLKIFKKAKLRLNLKDREVVIRIKGPVDEYIPVSFIHDTPIAPILLK